MVKLNKFVIKACFLYCTCETHYPCDHKIIENRFDLPGRFQQLFTCDEDNLERESITFGTSAMGVG